MQVYRIEHRSGGGAFDYGLAHDHDDNKHHRYGRSAYDHPGPTSEYGTPLCNLFRGYDDEGNRLLVDSHDFYFACRSKKQLRSWFGSKPGCRAMAKSGGLMVTYEVPDEHVFMGRTQLAFNGTKATKVSSVPADQW
jgi:hypothetical protein